MNERIFWTERFGKKILVMKFNNLMMDEYIKHLHTCYQFMEDLKRTDLLLLFDVTGATIFGDALKESKLFAKNIIPFRKKSALIGVTGAKKILLDSVLLFSGTADKVKTFDKTEQAELWLSR